MSVSRTILIGMQRIRPHITRIINVFCFGFQFQCMTVVESYSLRMNTFGKYYKQNEIYIYAYRYYKFAVILANKKDLDGQVYFKNYIGVSVFLMIVLKVANIKSHNFVLLKIQQYSTVQYNTTLATGLAQHLFLHSRLPDYSY